MEETKKVGRPSAGMDYSRETVRLSEHQHKVIVKYAQAHGYINTSAAIRGLIDEMGFIMELSDTIEEGLGMLHDAAKIQQELVGVFNGVDEQTADMLEESADEIRRVASLLSVLCYNENLPDVKQKHFEFQRSGGKLLIKERERKINKKYWLE